MTVAITSLWAPACWGIPGFKWHDRRNVPGHRLPPRVKLVVDTSERVQQLDEHGYVDTMVLVIQQDLRERGVEAEIISPKPRVSPRPRIEIALRSLDEGDAASSLATGAVFLGPVAGTSELVVFCQSVSSDNRALFSGTITAGQPGSMDARSLAESLGHVIAETLTVNQ